MIDLQKSAELNGVEPIELYSWFIRFPKSGKRIICYCNICGKKREITYSMYRNLCYTCANGIPERREKLRIAALGNKNALGYKHTDEALQKMRIVKLGNKNALGHEVSDEIREKIRFGQLGNKNGLGYKHTDEALQKMRIVKLGHEVSDETREKIRFGNLGHEVSDKTLEKMSESSKKRWEDPEQRILHSCRMLEISRDEWDGFGSVYCDLWCEELREHIRDKYNRQCFICNKTEEDNGRKLDVHHIDYNKDCGCDGTECRLVPLCMSCHGKTTFGDREMWEELIMDMLEKIE